MLKRFQAKALIWAKKRYLGLFAFNIILLILTLLHTARYFDPIYEISINFVLSVAMIMAVAFLGARSRVMFVISIFFLIVAACFQAIRVNIWAERSGIYAFDAMVLGVLLLVFENVGYKSGFLKYNLKQKAKDV